MTTGSKPASLDHNRRATPTRPPAGVATGKYDAFLSYNHADLTVATAIQRGLHRFARPLWALRSVRVYRDHTDLAAAPDLWPPIAAALDDSRYLVVLLSPGAAASRHVAHEIDHWLERDRAANLLLAVADGDVVWDATRRRFDASLSTAIPIRLCEPDLFGEPLYVDLRPCRLRERGLTLDDPEFRQGILSLAAPLHGSEKGELESEDRSEQRRLLRLRRAAIVTLCGLVVVASAAATVAKTQRDTARSQRRIAEARAFAAQANAASAPWEALPFAIEALRHTAPPLGVAKDAYARAMAQLERSPLQPESPPLIEHHQSVLAIAFAPDGRRMATSGGTPARTPVGQDDGTVRIWSVGPNGAKLERRLAGLEGGSTGSLAWSPDGTRLAAASNEGVVLVYTTDSWSVALSWREHDRGRAGVLVESPHVAWSGGRIVVGDNAGDVRVHDATSGKVVWQHHTEHGAIYALSAMGRRVALGVAVGKETAVELLDTGLVAAAASTILPAGAGLVQALAWSPDGKTLLAGAERSILRWSRPGTGTPAAPVVLPEGSVTQIAWTADGRRYASAGTDGAIRIWRADGTQILDAVAAHAPAVLALAWSPDGRRLASGGNGEDLVRTWRYVETEPRRFAPFPGAQRVVVSPDGRYLVGFDGTSAVLWEVRSRGTGRKLGLAVQQIAFSSDGNRLAVVGLNFDRDPVGVDIGVFDLNDGSRVGEIVAHAGRPTSAGLTADGGRLAIGNSSGELTVYNLASKAPPLRESTGHGAIRQLAWHPDGDRIALSTTTSVQVWSIAERMHSEHELDGSASKALAWLDRHVLLGVGTDNFVNTWRPPQRTPHRSRTKLVRDDANTATIAETRIISGDEKGNLVVADVASDEIIGDTFDPGDGWISSVSSSNDGSVISTVANSGALHVWRATTSVEACRVALTALGQDGLAALVGTTRPACADPATVHEFAVPLKPVGRS